MTPQQFCIKANDEVNNAIITSVLNCTRDLYYHGLSDDSFVWENDEDNTCQLFSVDFYIDDDGEVTSLKEMTNVVINFKDRNIYDGIGFGALDIFSDRVEICNEYQNPILVINLDKDTELDEGFIFQLQTQSAHMLLTLEHLQIIHQISKKLVDEYKPQC